jgi:ligand-binding sensor domain-containing protein/two-component sensor histidine kinase
LKNQPQTTSSYLLYFALVLSFSSFTFASEHPAFFLPNHISTALGDKPVSALLELDDGLWIGTQNGLYVYDGRSLRMPSENQNNIGPFLGSHITSLSSSPDGNIWISSLNQGVVKYDSELNSFSRPFSLDKSQLITSMLMDSDSNLWIAGDKGAFVLSAVTKSEAKSAKAAMLDISGSNFDNILDDKNGFIWMTSDQGIVIYNKSEKNSDVLCNTNSQNCDLNSEDVSALFLADDGKVYIGSKDGLVTSIDTTSRAVEILYDSKKHGATYITSILKSQDIIWIGTDVGLIQTNIETRTSAFFSIDKSRLSNNHITKVISSKHGLWIGTYKGINLLTSSSIANYNFRNSGVFNEVLSFTEDKNDRIFIGTYQGVYLFDKPTGSHRKLAIQTHEGDSSVYRSMSVVSQGDYLYIGTRGSGLMIYDLKNDANNLVESFLANTSITRMHIAPDKSVWVATYNSGLFKVNSLSSGKYVVSSVPVLPIDSGPIVTLSNTKAGSLLVGTETQLYIIEANSSVPHKLEIDFGGLGFQPVILSAKMDNNGNIWIGTLSNGLYRIGKDEFIAKSINSTDSEGSESGYLSIYEIQFDSFNTVWCSTSNGIFRFGESGNYIGRIGINDGLQGETFNFGASFQDSDMNLYFGGSNGYNKIDPAKVKFNTDVPAMTLTDIYLNGKIPVDIFSLDSLETILLTHKQTSIRLDFNVQDYFLPYETIYLHRLHPLEETWNSRKGLGSATYTNLPPGEYFFHAQGTDSSGNTNTDGIQLKIVVHPPPWRTWWAYTLYALCAAALFWSAWRWHYTFRVKEQAMAYARDMNIEAESAIDELQEQLDVQDSLVNSVHRRNIATLDFLDEVTSLSERVANNSSPSHSRRSVAALKCLENSLLYQQDRLYADLHRCTEDITALLLSEHENIANSVSIINDVTNKPIEAEVGALLAVVIYELVQNSLLHAFTGRPLGNFIKVSVQAVDRPAESSVHYRLAVNDNGIGMPDDFLKDKNGDATLIELIANRLGGNLTCPESDGSEVILTFSRSAFEA